MWISSKKIVSHLFAKPSAGQKAHVRDWAGFCVTQQNFMLFPAHVS
jgi:hypothetical protein